VKPSKSDSAIPKQSPEFLEVPKIKRLYDFEPPRRAASAKAITTTKKIPSLADKPAKILCALCPVATRKKLIRIGTVSRSCISLMLHL